jgi:hypothetical protein
MKVLSNIDGRYYKVVLEQCSSLSILEIAHQNRFEFDWSQMVGRDVVGLKVLANGHFIGLMATMDRVSDMAVEILLIESSKENVGAAKEYQNIAGILIAQACRMAFRKGYGGFVCLKPKTRLVRHYVDSYGMQIMGQNLVLFEDSADRLIKKYLST